VIAAVQAPFASAQAREVLLRAGSSLHPKGLADIAAWLKATELPVLSLYGARDRILPDVAKTARRLRKDVKDFREVVVPDAGHFLQEEQPEEVGRVLAAFFDEAGRAS
jgi:pimeloyl-ACP methyl ester carboxylesterase